MREHRQASSMQRVATLWVAALLLCLTALWNGQPFFYPDTPTYLRGAEMGVTRLLGPAALKPWLPAPAPSATDSPAAPGALATDPARRMKPLTSIQDKVVLAGRSAYYGVLLYAGYLAGKMWLSIALQALAVAYVLQLVMQRLWGLRSREVLATVAALSLLTPLGVYTGFLMPDIFAPLAVLCMAALAVYWRELPAGHRWALGAILLFGLCAHASHVALAAGLLVLALAARWLSERWRGLSLAGLAVAAACIAGAVAAEWVFAKAVTVAVGAPPLRLPHPAARLIDLGPGTAYLRQNCPDAGFAACEFLPNYPTSWDDFLFSTDPSKGAFALADAATKRRLSDEQLRLVGAVIRFDPVGVASGVGADVLRQLVNFRVDVSAYDGRGLAMFEGRMPDALFADMRASRAANGSPLNEWLTWSTYALVLASALALAVRGFDPGVSSGNSSGAQERRFSQFMAFAVAGVVTNAVICATLASSLDRFQSRIVWLLPFMALALLARRRAQRRLPAPGTGHVRAADKPPPGRSDPLPTQPTPPTRAA